MDPVDPDLQRTRALCEAAALPQRWRGTAAWTVLDLDFADGDAFLAIRRAWRDDPHRPTRLRYAALSVAPLPASRLRERLSRAGIPDGALLSRWPPALTGVHRIESDDGRVQLTLAVGAPAAMLQGLVTAADTLLAACYPGRPGIDPAVLRAACARLAGHGRATIAAGTDAAWTATWRTLHAAGFEPDPERPANAPAAPLTVAPSPPAATAPTLPPAFAPAPLASVSWRTAVARRRYGPAPSAATAPASRTALVVGAGLTGSAVSFALARRGWSVLRIDARDRPAQGGSGQPLLAHHPSVTPDDAPLSRLTRSALLLSHGPFDTGVARWIGRLQLVEPGRARAASAGLPDAWCRAVDAAEASARAGVALRSGGLWLPWSGVADPAALCASWTPPPVRTVLGRRVARLERIADGWVAADPSGAAIGSAAVVVIATGSDDLTVVTAAGAAPVGLWSLLGPAGLQRRSGVTTRAHVPSGAAPGCVVGGDGHALPLPDGSVLLGPADASDPAEVPGRAWRRYAAQLTHRPPDAALAPGRAGERLSTRDHLPIAGPVPDPGALHAALDGRRDAAVPTLDGLWIASACGGRGLLWSVLMAESIAARLEGEPAPIESSLARALSPDRFLLGAIRRADHAG